MSTVKAATAAAVAESRPTGREFPEQLCFLVLLTALVISAAGGAAAMDRKMQQLGISHGDVTRLR
jgi:hypothetical protein